MFPIPWDFPFRKKNGDVTTIGDVVGGGGGSDIPSHTSADAGKVLTVGDDGSLEWDENGAGGGDSFLSYDFTKVGNFTINGVEMSSAGAEFNSANDYFELINQEYKTSDITIYVDTGNLVIIPSSVHQRLIITGQNYSSGLIWRYTDNVWSIYDGNNWAPSEITDTSFFDNCSIKVYIDSDRYWHVYKDNTLVLESLAAITSANKRPITLGSSTGQSISQGIIKAVRVYNGNYTE